MGTPAPPLFIVFDARSVNASALACAQRLSARLDAAGHCHEQFLLGDEDELGNLAGRAVHAARAAGGAVVVAGAPAVVNAVLQAAWNARLPLGMLPWPGADGLGSSELRAQRFDAAAGALLSARVQEVPVGQLGEKVFLAQAELGLMPDVAATGSAAARRGAAARAGSWRSNLAALWSGRSLLTAELHAHGGTRVVRTRALGVRCTGAAAVGTASHQAAAAFSVSSLRVPTPLGALWRIARGIAGRADESGMIDRFEVERLIVRPRRGRGALVVRLDGESLALAAPLRFQAAPWPLRLLSAGQEGARP